MRDLPAHILNLDFKVPEIRWSGAPVATRETQAALLRLLPEHVWRDIERAALAERAGDSIAANNFRDRAGYRTARR